ncbi:hypothetical protein RIF29_38382 [Crotalaria pallida]|uniref:Uncharacterized protein n=1 Tax=Crotalaria pallida TaxID=3830 RepID=A0AAN9E5F2_CROPI
MVTHQSSNQQVVKCLVVVIRPIDDDRIAAILENLVQISRSQAEAEAAAASAVAATSRQPHLSRKPSTTEAELG